MKYMLDTNIIIMAVRHRDRPLYRKVWERLHDDACISALVYAELEYGLHKRDDGGKNRVSIMQLLEHASVLPFDREAAKHFGDIYADLDIKHMRIGDRDALIAAHARAMGYTMVTDNIREFARVEGLDVENWREPEPLP